MKISAGSKPFQRSKAPRRHPPYFHYSHQIKSNVKSLPTAWFWWMENVWQRKNFVKGTGFEVAHGWRVKFRETIKLTLKAGQAVKLSTLQANLRESNDSSDFRGWPRDKFP